MEQIFESVKEIEKKISSYLSEDSDIAETLMIENAANALCKAVIKYYDEKKSVLLLCGSGNNGADGYTLARRLAGLCKVNIISVSEPKSKFCKAAFKNLKSFIKHEKIKCFPLPENAKNTEIESIINDASVIVDCIFGTGFHGTAGESVQNLFKIVNHCDAKRIACDIPSGLDSDGTNIAGFSLQQKKHNVFFADKTVSMGGHKTGLFSDDAKDAAGKIERAEIGVSSEIFFNCAKKIVKENKIFLLKKSDADFPVREEKNTHKGKFGHAAVFSGEKKGAAILCASGAFACGAGLASIISSCEKNESEFKIPASIMVSKTVPENVTACALGCGFGRENDITEILSFVNEKKIPVVLDADAFYYKETIDFISEKKDFPVVMTPHPKEITKLLELSGLGHYSTVEFSQKRIFLLREISKKYSDVVFVSKGANTFIAQNGTIYISTYGTQGLSKGGSGDVLAGAVTGLLAQGYDALNAAVTGVLMHSLASKKFSRNYSLTPEELILKL